MLNHLAKKRGAEKRSPLFMGLTLVKVGGTFAAHTVRSMAPSAIELPLWTLVYTPAAHPDDPLADGPQISLTVL